MTEFTHVAIGMGYDGDTDFRLHENRESAVYNSRYDFKGDDWKVYEITKVAQGKVRTLQEIAREAVERTEPGRLIAAVKYTREQFKADHGDFCGFQEAKDAVEQAIMDAALAEWRNGPRRTVVDESGWRV